MACYRRAQIDGAMYFFTVNLANRKSTLLVDAISELRHAVRYVQRRHPFEIQAWVVLPDHMHAMWTLPLGDTNYSTRWRLIKSCFSRTLPGFENRSASRTRKRERGIWQRRFWEHVIRNERDYRIHMDYVHFNPVKHGYVEHVGDWPYSTFHRCVAAGMYPPEWGHGVRGFEGDFGEVSSR